MNTVRFVTVGYDNLLIYHPYIFFGGVILLGGTVFGMVFIFARDTVQGHHRGKFRKNISRFSSVLMRNAYMADKKLTVFTKRIKEELFIDE